MGAKGEETIPESKLQQALHNSSLASPRGEWRLEEEPMPNPKLHEGDTETSVVSSIEEAKKFAKELLAACESLEETPGVKHVHGIFEQSQHKGPWGIVFHVCHNPY